MIEKIIVIVLVIAAAVGWILYARKEAKRTCEGCEDCKLKDNCNRFRGRHKVPTV